MTNSMPMATSATTSTETSGPLLAALAAGAAMSVLLVVKNTNDGPAWRVTLVLSIAIALVSWLVFGRVVARAATARAASRRALILGIVTLLATAVFWMAVQPVLAAGTFVLARRSSSSAAARVGLVLAALGFAAGVVLTVVA
jgi:hypothetical protein